jgi:hypothetical protein
MKYLVPLILSATVAFGQQYEVGANIGYGFYRNGTIFSNSGNAQAGKLRDTWRLTLRSILILWLAAWYSNVTATQYVDDLEPMLAANRDAYLSGPHTVQRQQAALQYFDQNWSWLKSSSACGSKLLKQAGQSCINGRSRSGPWSWERYHRDPITATPGR